MGRDHLQHQRGLPELVVALYRRLRRRRLRAPGTAGAHRAPRALSQLRGPHRLALAGPTASWHPGRLPLPQQPRIRVSRLAAFTGSLPEWLRTDRRGHAPPPAQSHARHIIPRWSTIATLRAASRRTKTYQSAGALPRRCEAVGALDQAAQSPAVRCRHRPAIDHVHQISQLPYLCGSEAATSNTKAIVRAYCLKKPHAVSTPHHGADRGQPAEGHERGTADDTEKWTATQAPGEGGAVFPPLRASRRRGPRHARELLEEIQVAVSPAMARLVWNLWIKN